MRDSPFARECRDRQHRWILNRGAGGATVGDMAVFLGVAVGHAAKYRTALVNEGRLVWLGRTKPSNGKSTWKIYHAVDQRRENLYPPPSAPAAATGAR
jgi:hypothetical protein